MVSTRQGGCLCGASTYKFQGDAKFAIQCYCHECQRISGGGHLPQVAVAVDGFVVEGKTKSFKSVSDAGKDVELCFCDTCGSPLFKMTSKMPDIRFICAGSLSEDLVVEPFQRVFEDCKRVWDA